MEEKKSLPRERIFAGEVAKLSIEALSGATLSFFCHFSP
jgi:hypothetical protein